MYSDRLDRKNSVNPDQTAPQLLAIPFTTFDMYIYYPVSGEVMTNQVGQVIISLRLISKVSKGAKIRNRYNQVPHLTQDTNGKVTNSQLDTTNESQEVSSFPAGDHKAHINRRTQRHSKHKTEKNPIKDPQKKYHL